ncbi:MAG: 3'-5' exonuclease [Bacteroidota bacterium]
MDSIARIDTTKVLFLDIETVSGCPVYEDLSEDLKALWALKARSILKRYDSDDPIQEDELSATYLDRAAIYAEFGKIVCISVGVLYRDRADQQIKIRLKSYANDDEAQLLKDFSALLDQYYKNPSTHFMCGHNIKEFDVPYMCRRMVVHQLPFPTLLDISGKKPWETKHLLDTMELWKFGDRKAYTSLKLLAATLGFPSPKDDIDGSMVGRVYWEDKDLDRIAHYCEKDTLATAQLFLRYQRKPLLTEDQVTHLSEK